MAGCLHTSGHVYVKLCTVIEYTERTDDINVKCNKDFIFILKQSISHGSTHTAKQT